MFEHLMISEKDLAEIELEIIRQRQCPAERTECVILKFPHKEPADGARSVTYRHPDQFPDAS